MLGLHELSVEMIEAFLMSRRVAETVKRKENPTNFSNVVTASQIPGGEMFLCFVFNERTRNVDGFRVALPLASKEKKKKIKKRRLASSAV